MTSWRAALLHVRARDQRLALVTVLSSTAAVWVGVNRRVLLPFSSRLLIEVPPIAPVAYAFLAVVLTSPRRFTLERPGRRDRAVRAIVAGAMVAVIAVSQVPLAVVHSQDAAITLRNGLLYSGVGLLASRMLEPALAQVVAGTLAVCVSYLGTTIEGTVRPWALPLRAASDVRAAWLAIAVLAIGFIVTLCEPPALSRRRPPRSGRCRRR